MQRERTALKVMQQMLVDRRDTLTVDDVIPVGDSFDYIVQGPGRPRPAGAPRCSGPRPTLYREKLQPILLRSRTTSPRATPPGIPAASRPFRADDRLAKTLLLSAVAPKVPGAARS